MLRTLKALIRQNDQSKCCINLRCYLSKNNSTHKEYGLNPNELRKTKKQIVYEHGHNEKVVYVGSGLWYRMRRSSTRRNLEHKELMEKGLIEYKLVAEYDDVKSAREHEEKLIIRYISLGQSRLNSNMTEFEKKLQIELILLQERNVARSNQLKCGKMTVLWNLQVQYRFCKRNIQRT